ncbi:MAG: type I restriction enzyme HsdR N-terminal domain-containing protein [Bacteroidales bacterium]|nr:type I restriction enzyme HsdR N-terminal domain-containing protein [Candidatus Colicola caccequi]
MNVKQIRGKDYILCGWRHKYVRLTPEEWVRQQVLHQLVTDLGYPASGIAVEVQLTTKRRADAVVYKPDLTPVMLIEFKAETVELSQKTLDQIAVYNRQYKVPYLLLSNGRQIVMAKVDEQQIIFLENIPEWTQLLN